MDKHIEIMSRDFDITGAPMTAQLFGNAGIEHMRKFGTTAEHFAKIAHKNHKHSVKHFLILSAKFRWGTNIAFKPIYFDNTINLSLRRKRMACFFDPLFGSGLC